MYNTQKPWTNTAHTHTSLLPKQYMYFIPISFLLEFLFGTWSVLPYETKKKILYIYEEMHTRLWNTASLYSLYVNSIGCPYVSLLVRAVINIIFFFLCLFVFAHRKFVNWMNYTRKEEWIKKKTHKLATTEIADQINETTLYVCFILLLILVLWISSISMLIVLFLSYSFNSIKCKFIKMNVLTILFPPKKKNHLICLSHYQ